MLKDQILKLQEEIDHNLNRDILSGCVEERLNKSFETYFNKLNEHYNNLLVMPNAEMIRKLKQYG
jgi:hypothetical protein